MRVYRLGKSAYATDLSGKGAEKAGGRWNSKGVAILYTSDSRALSTAEIAVHTPLGNLPKDYTLVSIEIPDELLIGTISQDQLPPDWKVFPHNHSTQEIGDAFIKQSIYPVLKAPSAVVQGEFNYLLNPNHPDFHRIKIVASENFEFDDRLFLK